MFVGLSACKTKRDTPNSITAPTLEKGESFFNVNNDSAFYYFNLVATSATDSLEIAIAYTYMGIIQAYEGDQYGGQESLLKSLTYLNENKEQDRECISSNYHELGNVCLNLKNYKAAVEYYYKGLQFMESPITKNIALNNIALTYQKNGEYDKAIELYTSLLTKNADRKKEYARVLSNYARTKWLKNPTYPAGKELRQALQIRLDSNDNRGLNASYAHLSDYYTNTKPDSALYFAEKRYAVAQLNNSTDDQIEALSKLISLSPPKLLKPYFVRYQFLSDSLQAAKNAAKNQFALIRFETLQLQKDNAQKEVQLVEQQYILVLTIFFFIAISTAIIIWYRKRQQQIKAASIQAIQENQLKTSQKVHDVVANGLYRIMTDVEHNDDIDKELLIDKIEDLYEKSRDISYDKPINPNIPFDQKIDELLTSFSSDNTRVLMVGHSAATWERTHEVAQYEVEHILQELMVNMKKHSQASNVVLKFERQQDRIHIHYTDDGIGFSPQVKYGNGWQNTENRIHKIQGEYTFEHPTKGLKIHISFPIAYSS
ncbi:tetratricopeptide repeat protein [Chitinophaga skermanii]|nr:tetratricopeptide repeat protein [Chitinophaga skermanii]